MPNMINLHVHSQFSLLDGLDSPDTLVQAAKDLGQTAIAITDHGTLAGHRALQRACVEHGLKPILGVEAYISPTDRFDKRSISKRKADSDNTQIYNHIILLAKNQTGVENINKLSKIAWTEGFYHKPRIDREVLKEHSEGIIVLTGCLSGIPAKALEAHNESGDIAHLETGSKFLLELKEAFGEDLYIEIQSHNPEYINNGLMNWSNVLGIKPAITADCHYAYERDRALEDAFLVLSTNPQRDKEKDYKAVRDLELLEKLNELYPERFMTFQDYDLFVGSHANLAPPLVANGLYTEQMFDSTLEIADKIGQYEFYKGLELLPSEFDDPVAELERLVLNGLRTRGVDNTEYIDRVTEEMRVIRAKNFAPYFLIVRDAVSWAKENGIMVGPGRGSAAGSLVCYALGITDVDPLKYNLLFARFINEERNDFPDIDVDFQDSRRGEVKEYLRNKYGYVASIATFTHFAGKGALKDSARVLGVPYGDVERAMKLVPQEDGFEYYSNYPSTNDDALSQFKTNYPEVERLASKLIGRMRGSGMHAGGLVISKEPIEKYAPVETNKDPDDEVSGRIPVVACDMNDIEEIGLIKLDILGLKALSVVNDCIDLIKTNRGEVVNPLEIPLDDTDVYKSMSEGYTSGIFQFDTPTSTRLIQRVKPQVFEDIVLATSLVRPGAMDTVGEELLARKHGNVPVSYVHDTMKPYLENSYGLVIYQEQVMQAAVQLGGMSWSKADKLRKIIGKKRDASEFDQYRDEFIQGATTLISKQDAERLWHDFEAHAGYSFNRSHAVAYSMISMWTAWLKYHYPLEFMTAVLRNEGDKDKLPEFFIECKRLEIDMLLPHVNKSEANYTIEDGKIRFGLNSIKFISDKVAAHIIRHRPYKNYSQFLDIAMEKYSGINSRAVESLNAVGAAAFGDNPRTGDESDNYYEYMNIPEFKSIKLTNTVKDAITSLEDYDQDMTCIVGGMVKNIKKGKGWSLIDIVDETGTGSLFDVQDTHLRKGTFYYLLVSEKRVMAAITTEDLERAINGAPETPLAEFLVTPIEKLVSGAREVYLVRWKPRKTKTGKLMGNIIAANKERSLANIVVFPSTYGRVFNKLHSGETVELNIKNTGDDKILLDVKG